jgi:hypothetical protein
MAGTVAAAGPSHGGGFGTGRPGARAGKKRQGAGKGSALRAGQRRCDVADSASEVDAVCGADKRCSVLSFQNYALSCAAGRSEAENFSTSKLLATVIKMRSCRAGV